MNIKEKVKDLLKYCSSYQGHAYMMDERRRDETFQVLLPEEKLLREEMRHLQFILLTGEAGDGKSRLLRNLSMELQENGFEIHTDFSAIPEASKQEIIRDISDIAEGRSDKRIIIAANIGIFTKSVLAYQQNHNLMERLNDDNSHIRIINFEKRNLAQDRDIFGQIVKAFLQYDGNKCDTCSNCLFKENLDYLKSDRGIESLRVLCDAIYLIGEHITFRELLSLLAYVVTFGEECEMRKQRTQKELSESKRAKNTGSRESAEDAERALINACSCEDVFSRSEDKVLQLINRMDPAYKKFAIEDCASIEECIRRKRQFFFQTDHNKYALLNIDYLSEFRQVLDYFQANMFVDSSSIQEGVLYALKRGLGRLTRKGQSDLGMSVADTPSILGDDIQTEFELGNLDMIWHRYGIDFNHLEKDYIRDESRNRFCLSYVYNDSDERLHAITMVIDYRLFRYIMMADNYFYFSHDSKSVEEYTINTFFRKILKTRRGVYGKMMVKFTNQKQEGLCNFSLSIQKKQRILFRGEKVIKLKKEG